MRSFVQFSVKCIVFDKLTIYNIIKSARNTLCNFGEIIIPTKSVSICHEMFSRLRSHEATTPIVVNTRVVDIDSGRGSKRNENRIRNISDKWETTQKSYLYNLCGATGQEGLR